MSNERLSEFMQSDLIKKMHKSMKREVLILASDVRQDSPPRIPTGIFGLDFALGGGFPVGRLSLVWGPKASFKTSMLLKAISSAQKMCANCWIPHNPITGEIMCACKNYRPPIIAYLDVEGAMDFSWAGVLGVDPAAILYSIPDHGEQAVDICDALLRSAECDIVCLDSLAFLLPIKEAEESAEKGLMGEQPRLIGKAIRKFIGALNTVGTSTDRRPTLLLVNQTRQKMTMFGDPTVQPGGVAPGFMASIEIRTHTGKYQDVDSGRIPGYVDLGFRIEKSKVGPSKIESQFRLLLMDNDVKKKGEVQDEIQIMEFLELAGMLERKGNKWHCFDQEFPQKSLVERKITTDPAFSYLVRSKLMERLLKSYNEGIPLGSPSEEAGTKKGAKRGGPEVAKSE